MHRILTLSLLSLTLIGAEVPVEQWTTFRGDAGDGWYRSPVPLVDALSKARLLWQSEAVIRCDEDYLAGGYASPVIGDGRVYIYHFEPSGPTDPKQQARIEKAIESGSVQLHPGETPEQLAGIDADDVVTAIDLRTGKTVWQRRFAGGGLNITHGKSGGHFTPCYGDGMVFAIGSAGRIYCLDAATGEPRWQSALDTAPAFDQVKAYLKEQGSVYLKGGARGYKGPTGGQLNACPRYANGVAVFADQTRVYGYDATTGQRLWTTPDGPVRTETPALWRHGDTAYVIYHGSKGMTCVEIKSGKQMWAVAEGRHVTNSISISGDYAIPSGDDDIGLSCWKLSPQKAEKVWGDITVKREDTGDKKWLVRVSNHNTPLIMDGRVYVQCETVNTATGRGNDIYCLDLATGAVLFSLLDVGKNNGPSFTGAGRLMICFFGNNVYRADDTDFAILEQWQPKLMAGSARCTIPAFHDGLMVLRNAVGLACYDLRAH